MRPTESAPRPDRGGDTPSASAPARHVPPIRVCMVTSALPLGGAERLQLSVLSGLAGAGFECQVLCLREPGDMAPLFEDAGVPVTVMPRRRWQHLATIPVLARWLRSRGIDIVLATTHVPSLHLTLAAAKLARVRGTVLGLHQTGGRDIGLPSLPRRSVDLLFLLDALVLLSRAQLEYIRDVEGYGSRPWRRTPFAIIPNGVAVGPVATASDRAWARAEMGVGARDLVVGCVAALRPEKDHETLLRAIARLAPSHPALRLALIGSGPREAALREEVGRLGIRDRVAFTGFRTDVDRLLPALDVFCLTSVQETYPVSVLEAMAAGLPVVMTDPPGVPEIVDEGRTGRMVPVGDDAAIASCLAELLDDPARATAMGVAGRERAIDGYSIEVTLARYASLMASLAGVAAPDAPGGRTGGLPGRTYGMRRAEPAVRSTR